MLIAWEEGREGPEFTEAWVGTDHLYTFQQGASFGYGIRLDGIGLIVLSWPKFASMTEAQRAAEVGYAEVDGYGWKGLSRLVDDLPNGVRNSRTPKHPGAP